MTHSDHTQTATAHTPGPWDYDMDYIVAPDPNERYPDIYIAEIAHSDDEGRIASPEQQDANRWLVAAAPELLEALNGILAWADDSKFKIDCGDSERRIWFYNALEKSRDAIAKATAERRSV
jgi:hypothetical protein